MKHNEGFAHLTLRTSANRLLLVTKDFELRNVGDLYILDEVYGNGNALISRQDEVQCTSTNNY